MNAEWKENQTDAGDKIAKGKNAVVRVTWSEEPDGERVKLLERTSSACG